MGLNQAQLGKLVGVSGNTIWNWEKKGKVQDKYMRKLDKALASGFVPFVPEGSATIKATMPNGVVLEIAGVDALKILMEACK